MMAVFTANAQIAIQKAKFFDNVYLGVHGGASTPLTFNSVFPVNPGAGLTLGKELTPVFGIELEGKAIPRHGYAVLTPEGEEVGEVTTGYHCISVDKSVCLALVKSGCAALGTPLLIQIRKKTFPGTVVKKRFYDKHYKK